MKLRAAGIRRCRLRLAPRAGVLIASAAVLGGCGFDVESPDLFLVTRSGPSPRLTVLVNSSGTITCNASKPKQLSDPLLIQARALSTSLNDDVKLRFTRNPHSVFTYTVRVQNGTFTFPDTAASGHKELAQLEQFVLQVGADPCGVGS
jgi:hypothetical protein